MFDSATFNMLTLIINEINNLLLIFANITLRGVDMRRRMLILVMFLSAIFFPILTGCCAFLDNDDNDSPPYIDIYFEESHYYLEKGSSQQLVVCFFNENISDKTITWSIEGDGAITIDENGVVTAHDIGWGRVTATSATGHTAQCYLDVKVSPTGIAFDKTEIETYDGFTEEIVATLLPSDCTEGFVTWTSSNTNVAEIWGGEVYAREAGTATITATTINGITATCQVTVKPYIKVQNVILTADKNSIIIPYEDSSYQMQVTAKVYPANASFPEIEWSSSDESVATVDENGWVSFIASGNVTISANTRDNIKKTYVFNVTKEIIATSISISSSLTLIEGNLEKRLSVSWTPYNTTIKTVTWSSSNENVAVVNNGYVTPISVGTAYITATTTRGLYARCLVTVTPRIYASSITLNKTTLTIEETKTDTLVATVLPNNTTDKSVIWRVADESIATVSSTGLVTGIVCGTTTVTATTKNGLTAECEVIVEELKVPVSLSVNGEIVGTVYTVKSRDYKITIPGRFADMTSNSSLSNYFHGWCSDEECVNFLTGEEMYPTASTIYAKDIEIDPSRYVLTKGEYDSSYTLTKYNNTDNSNIIVIPSTVGDKNLLYINARAIYADSNVKTIVFQGHFNFTDNAIQNCSNLEKVWVNNTSKTFNTKTINNCNKIRFNEYKGLKYVGSHEKPYIFPMELDVNVDSVTIADECYSVNSDVFKTDTKLKYIEVEDGNTSYLASGGILYENKNYLKMLYVPSQIEGAVTILKTITGIPEGMFQNRTKLTSVNLNDDVRFIYEHAFHGCTGLVGVTGHENVHTIKTSAFDGCSSLTQFEFVEGLSTIGYRAFAGCMIEEVIIYKTTAEISSGAFAGCAKIKSIQLPSAGTSLIITFGGTPTTEDYWPFGNFFGKDKYEGGIATIQTYYENKTAKTETYYIPSSLTSVTITGDIVQRAAFSGIINKLDITIVNATTIETNAFKNANIGNLRLPSTITSIETSAMKMNSVDNIYYAGTITDWAGITLAGIDSHPNCNITNFYINNTILRSIELGEEIVAIKDYTFYNFDNVESVALHNKIESIGVEAFKDCSKISTIAIPSSVLTISNSAFADCVGLTTLTLESVETIGDYAFSGCSSIQEIILPDTVTTLGTYAFYGCSQLQGVTLSKNMTIIPRYAFSDCTSLADFEILNNIQEIHSNAFRNCISLKEFVAGETAVDLASAVFNGCSGLEKLVLPYLGQEGDSESKMVLGYLFGTSEAEGMYSANQAGDTYYIPTSLKYVTVRDGEIARYAFSNCAKIQSITIGENISSFGRYAFDNCLELESLNLLSKTLDEGTGGEIIMGAGVNSANGLTITFSEDLEVIPASFLKHTPLQYMNVKTIVFGEGTKLTSIGDYAFSGLTSLVNVNIPSSVDTIGNYAFSHCTSLANICVDSENANYSTIDGSLYNKGGTKLIQYALGKPETSYEIGGDITEIVSRAFEGSKLTNIIFNAVNMPDQNYNSNIFLGLNPDNRVRFTIGKDITHVPNHLCSTNSKYDPINIYSFDFAEGSICETIGDWVFKGCTTLEHIELLDTLTDIGTNAFENCTGIKTLNYKGDFNKHAQIEYTNELSNPMYYSPVYTINEEVPESINLTTSTSIGAYAFYNFSDIETFTIGTSVESVGYCAFYNCYKIKNLVIPDSVTRLGGLAFQGCYGLESLTIPFVSGSETAAFGRLFGTESYDNSYSVLPYNATSMSQSNLTIYYIPNNLSRVAVSRGIIPIGSFSDYKSLTSVVLGDGVTQIYNHAFNECNNLNSITFGENVTSIGNYAFAHCSKISEIVFQNKLTSIGNYAFTSCSSLNTVQLGNGVISIGSYSFNSCQRLNVVEVGDDVTSIGSYAFNKCSSLSWFDMPSKVETIGEGAFTSCYGLKSLKLGANLTSIGDKAFKDCVQLIELYDLCPLMITSGELTHGGVAYYAKAIHNNESVESVLETTADGYVFAELEEVSYLISCLNNVESLTLPTRDRNYIISQYSFIYLDNLTSVVVPECVNGIESKAFFECENIDYLSITHSVKQFPNDMCYESSAQDVKIHHFNYVGTLDEWLALEFGTNLNISPMTYANKFTLNGEKVTSFTLPANKTSIGDFAFYGFSDLRTVQLHSELTTIGGFAFAYCTSLTSIDLAQTKLHTIERSAFEHCLLLSNVTMLSKGITSMGSAVFKSCMSLESIQLPTTISYISDEMFANCERLKNIVIDSNITAIGRKAFGNCKNFESLYIPDTVKYIDTAIVSGCEKLTSIRIPSLSSITGDGYNLFGSLFTINALNEDLFYRVQQFYSSEDYSVYYLPLSLKTVTVEGGHIGYGAFQDCTSITSIILGDGITSVDTAAFDFDAPHITMDNAIYYADGWALGGVANIVGVKLKEGAVGVAISAFTGYQITLVEASSSLRIINDYAFKNCAKLKTISLNDNLAILGEEAFSNCGVLQTVSIPSGVTSIGMGAFYNCNNVYRYDVASNNSSFVAVDGNLYTKNQSMLIQYAVGETTRKTFTVPSSVKTIGYYAFKDSVLTSITFAGNVVTIQEGAFYGCSSLSTLVLPATLQNISDKAFYNCSGLLRVEMGTSVKEIGVEAFAGCSKLDRSSSGVVYTYTTQWDVTDGKTTQTLSDNIFTSARTLASALVNTYKKYRWIRK